MEIRFDELKNMAVPDEWTEKALALPEKLPESKRFRLHTLYLAAGAACLVLAAFIGVSAWLMKPSETPPVMPAVTRAPETSASAVEAKTEANTESAAATEPTEEPKTEITVSEPAEEPVTEPLPEITVQTEPEPVTDPAETSCCVTEPQIASDTTAPTFQPAFPDGCTLIAVFSADRLTEGGVYCRMLDENGAQLGEPDLFDAQHSADVTLGGEKVRATYRPIEKGLMLEEGKSYSIVFYTDSGETLVQSVPMPIQNDLVIMLRG